MQLSSKIIVSIVLSIFSYSVFAAQYVMFIDAGSSGSRLHLFQYEKSTAHLPEIKDIFSQSTKPGLSSYANNPEEAGQSLKKILDEAKIYLEQHGINPAETPINVLATAGMRLLPDEQQQQIYASVRNYLSTHYAFPVKRVETISGKLEGLYGWLDINYLLGHFQHHRQTVGAIDMGGGSTQIAFATLSRKPSDDILPIRINHRHYRVFSKSFLGLGQDQARNAMLNKPFPEYCYPKNYMFTPNNTGNFNFSSCATNYLRVIEDHRVTDQILPTQGNSFYAFSGLYLGYQFFGVDKTPEQSVVEANIQTTCNKTWEQLQIEYPDIDTKYLSANCANGVYHTQLLYNTYKINGAKLTVTDQINKVNLDWTLGAVLHSLL